MKNYDIYITGTIGMDIDADYIQYRLQQLADQPVSVLVQSLGGDCNTALAVYAMFREHGNVSVHFRAMSASAATILAMGAKHISMDEEALILVHKAKVPVVEIDWLNADDIKTLVGRLNQAAENLDTIDEVITAIYAKRSGNDAARLAELMEKEKWLKADEALSLNLIDEVTPAEENIKNQIVNAGMPLPPNTQERLSLLDRFINLFTAKNMDENTTPVKLDNIASVIGDVALNSDGCAHIDAAQLAKLDNALAQMKQENGSLTCINEQLRQRVKALEDMPAADSTKQVIEAKTVENNKTDDALTAYHNVQIAARKLYDSI